MKKFRPKSQGVLEALLYDGKNLEKLMKAFGVENVKRIVDEDTGEKCVCLEVFSKNANAKINLMISEGDMIFFEDGCITKLPEKDFMDRHEAVDKEDV